MRPRLRVALVSPAVEVVITAFIVLNAVVLGALTYSGHSAWMESSLWRLDLAIVAVFVVELGLKLFAFGRSFFRKPWNVFDFVVIAIGVLGAIYPFTIIRSLRVLRILRLVKRVPSMRAVVEGFLRALPGIGSVLTVLLLMIFVYAVLGTQLYGERAPDLFGSLEISAFTLFAVLTLEGWDAVARTVMAGSPGAWVFFVSFIAINSFAVLNLMIAVIINSMQKDYDDHAEEEREDILEEVRALRAELRDMRAAL